jgi:hypothetical protein
MSLITALLLSAVLSVQPDAACDSLTLIGPAYACRAGQATVAAPVLDGATYSWSIEGGAIVAGAGTPRVTMVTTRAGSVKATCVITTSACSRVASVEVPVRDAIGIDKLNVPAGANANEPVTITWSYGAAAPVSQLLTGDAFEAPVPLAGGVRSYTFTPKRAGVRSVELRASYYTAMPSAAPQRRRATGGSASAASDCGSVSVRKAIEVRGCSSNDAFMIVPGVVDAGATFDADLELDSGERAEWAVTNGTLLAVEGGHAQVRAGEAGPVEITAAITRGACERSSHGVVPVVPAAVACNVPPTATVSSTKDCFSGEVHVAFTGTPPFRGTWSDGSTFNTGAFSITRPVDQPGLYALTSFRDATCIGAIEGAAQLDTFHPSATLELIGGACPNATLRAHLRGVPPFHVTWSDHTAVTTSEFEVERTVPTSGSWWAQVSDATCPMYAFESTPVQINYPPTATMYPGPYCQRYAGDLTSLVVYFSGGPPYSVTWSDGVTLQSTTVNQVIRVLPLAGTALQQYEIVSAMSNGCPAQLDHTIATVAWRPPPLIDEVASDFAVCPGETATASVGVISPGATLQWSITGGEILGGQGTRSVTYRLTGAQNGVLRATYAYADGACSSDTEREVRFQPQADVTDFRVPPSIKAGESVLITWVESNAAQSHLTTVENDRRGDISNRWCDRGICRAQYTDTHGAGSVTFDLQLTGTCGTRSVLRTMTITE